MQVGLSAATILRSGFGADSRIACEWRNGQRADFCEVMPDALRVLVQDFRRSGIAVVGPFTRTMHREHSAAGDIRVPVRLNDFRPRVCPAASGQQR